MQLKRSGLLRAIFGVALVAGLAALTLSSDMPVASAKSGSDVEVTFTKWVTDYPNMKGFVGGDLGSGVFNGEIISRNPNVANGRITRVEALYEVKGGASAYDAHTAAGATSFDALVDVWQNNQKGTAVFSGVIVEGYMAGERVTGGYKLIKCTEAATGTCFQGSIRIEREAID